MIISTTLLVSWDNYLDMVIIWCFDELSE